MKLYGSDGWVNIGGVIDSKIPFNFLLGGRGIGKTYTTLKETIERNINFLFMRRLQSQTDLINKPQFSPFKSLNKDLGINIVSKSISKYNSAFYNVENEEDITGLPIGYTCSLSTVASLRGFDASDCRLWIYDEFIPEQHERTIKNEGKAFLNAYETINRNRELKGEEPLQAICLANANDISNPIFVELGLVSIIGKMIESGQNQYIDKKRGIAIYYFLDSPISEKKKDTVLYKLTENSEFSKMSIDNIFLNYDNSYVKSRPLAEYKPIVRVGEITICQHKTNGRLYVTGHAFGSPPVFSSGSDDLTRYARNYSWVWLSYLRGNVDFDNILSKILLTKYHK